MLARILVMIVKLLIGAHARWLGCAPLPRQRIYFANHSSHLDTVALWSALPPTLRRSTRPVAARDYWGRGLRHWIASRGFHAVLIDRAREQADVDPLQPLYEVLERGQSLILFPEGTRNSEPVLLPFKSGIYRLAQRFPAVELVPVYLDNARRSMPKGSPLPVPLICTVRFGTPLSWHPEEAKEHFLERARQAVEALAQ